MKELFVKNVVNETTDFLDNNQRLKLKVEHFKRIELSNAILVVNINNYIGDSTNLEIDYAKKLEKEIIYYTDIMKDD